MNDVMIVQKGQSIFLNENICEEQNIDSVSLEIQKQNDEHTQIRLNR